MAAAVLLFSTFLILGYVLKPDFLLNKEISFNPNNLAEIQLFLTITIISGWQIPKHKGAKKSEIASPCVSLSVSGVAHDAENHFKTQAIHIFFKNCRLCFFLIKKRDNGFNPVWRETTKFSIRAPELAILKVMVLHEGDMLAFSYLAVRNLRSGIRVLELRGPKGEELKGSHLLCEFEINHNL